MGLAQIGEFSFIIASLGLTLNVTSRFLYPIAVAVSAITTLLTPYLIKGSDRWVNWFDRVAPRPLVGFMELYTQWVGQLGGQRNKNMAPQLVRNWLWQTGLNAALVAAVFAATDSVATNPPGWLRQLLLDQESMNAMLWLAAVITALPVLIAIFRKLQALGLWVAEFTVTEAAAGERTAAIRTVIAHLIQVAGLIALGLYVLALSSVLLPPLKVLLLLLVVVGLVTWLLWRSFIRIYARAQSSLEQIFTQPRSPRHPPAPAALPAILRDANLESVGVSAEAPAAGKLIRELRLRTTTGASIVGIERDGATLLNPGPDEELQAGDQVMLLGSRAQLSAARALFENPASPPADPSEKSSPLSPINPVRRDSVEP